MKAKAVTALFAVLAQTSASRGDTWYEAEAAAGDPLLSINRVGIGFEHAEQDGQREKLVLSTALRLGEKTGRNDWALAMELPFLMNDPAGGGSDEGVGDFKLRLTHTWLENSNWLAASYLETEFDTAASDVQAIANQRDQLAVGSGFIRNFGDGWAVGGAVQFGWSPNAGQTNGHKGEWECRVGVRKTFFETLSATVIYKGIINVVGEDQYNSTIEPTLSWHFGALGLDKLNCYVSCEFPLENNREDYTAKTGLAWVF
jgi:hypothetical protein